MILAKTAGFCFGVKRAVDMAYSLTGEENVYTYGPIIHNETVVDDLAAHGVHVISTLEEAKAAPRGTIIIRSHGISRAEMESLSEMGHRIVDATCPFVKKIHRIVDQRSAAGEQILIVGSRTHPEVMAIRGWCHSEPFIIETEDEAENFVYEGEQRICIVSQTTFNFKKFELIVEIIQKKGYDIGCQNTICNATEERQREARDIAGRADTMIVIGGRSSSNTQKLYDICRKECKNTYYIQTLVDLDLKTFGSIGNVGITAGASTPNNIIEEVYNHMSEMMNESFDEMLDASFVTIKNGDVVTGTVIDVKPNMIILNIHYKADGIITREEYSNEAKDTNLDLTTVVNVDDEMKVKVIKVNDGEGQVLLSYRRLTPDKVSKRVEDAFNNHEVLTAKVDKVQYKDREKEKKASGLSVTVDGTRIFIPASLVSDSFERDLKKYEGQEISFVITELNLEPGKKRIIGDRKQIVEAEKVQKKAELFARIEPGMIVEGRVKNVTKFGAFVDLDGADGLLHISEMSWGRVENPDKVVKVGDVLKVIIKNIEGEKIALSLKFPESNPWYTAAEKYAVGNVVEGRVARMTDFGAFIELEPGVDALLHVSQISKDRVEKPSDILAIDQLVTAKVVEFKGEEQKISLSIKALDAEEAPEEAPAEEAPAEAPVEEAPVEEAPAEEAPAEEAPVEE